MELMSLDWATQRLINLQNAWHEQMLAVLRKLGMTSIRDLRGRTDVLCYMNDVIRIPTGTWRIHRQDVQRMVK